MENKRTVKTVSEVKKSRFVALDVFRGLTIVLLLFYFNRGTGGTNPIVWLNHAPWLGLTLADCAYPLFMTAMGMSMVFSFRRYEKINGAFLRKVISRTLLLFGLGLIYNYCSSLPKNISEASSVGEGMMNALVNIRIYGVLQRYAIAFVCASFIIMLCKKNFKIIAMVGGGLLVAYLFILGFGHGYEFSKDNILYIIDNAILPANHLYVDTVEGVKLTMDPEGLFATLFSCVGQLLLSYAGLSFYLSAKENGKSHPLPYLFAGAILSIVLGLFITFFCPISKKVWSVSFVLITSGIGFALVALVETLTLKRPHQKLLYPFNVLGANAIFLYLLVIITSMVIKNIPVADSTLGECINHGFMVVSVGNEVIAALLYAIIFSALDWLVAWLLYRKKIFIRL
ncbi:MAG: hypothetical protein MJ206_01745 [Bacilli bacterium]|nr:hypothetical protein [Bacilli bacterium]